MTHAPKFWADKLPLEHRPFFWALIDFGFGGESAYYRTVNWYNLHKSPESIS